MIDIGPESKEITITEAWLYCACLYHDGYSDWRLPDWDEIFYIQSRASWDSSDTNRKWTDSDRFATLPVRNT